MTIMFWPLLKIGDVVTVTNIASHAKTMVAPGIWNKKVVYRDIKPFNAIFVGYGFMNEGTTTPHYREEGTGYRMTARVKVAQVRKTMHTPIFKIKAEGLKEAKEADNADA